MGLKNEENNYFNLLLIYSYKLRHTSE